MNGNRAVEAAGAFVRAFALGLVLCAGSGCVAFNVGKPEFFSKTVSVCETPETPTRSAAVSTVAVADQRDRELVVSLSASVRDEYDRLRHDETVTVTVRRRMAVGLFPGMAESLLMPPGALKSMAFEFNTDGTRLWDDKHGWKGVWNDIAGFARIGIPSLGLAPLVFSVDTLFFEPFASYSCVSHPWMEEDWRYGSEPNRSEPPNVRALSLLTWEERKRIGVFPRWNHSFQNYIDFMGHFALVGVRTICTRKGAKMAAVSYNFQLLGALNFHCDAGRDAVEEALRRGFEVERFRVGVELFLIGVLFEAFY